MSDLKNQLLEVAAEAMYENSYVVDLPWKSLKTTERKNWADQAEIALYAAFGYLVALHTESLELNGGGYRDFTDHEDVGISVASVLKELTND